ncbi:MAG: HIT domain-containing protein [Candidatus Omnitrophica bacterium]|nr:HIT domain-containing protein [Candidatus Omnitrophota bacterium]MDD5080986.1 HIT domain-containing protein [Candidatus Omnitrophota bacterium]
MTKNDRIWAPWRIDYVQKTVPEKGCIFCKVLKSKKDEKNLVVHRSKHCFVILNKYPYNNGHLMVVPNRHIAGMENLTDTEVLDINTVMINAIKKLKKTIKPKGFNIGMNIGQHSGAGIKEHIHVHIVPRWDGDTNFMPVIFDTKIISQSLDNFYMLIKDEWSTDEKI